MPPELGQAGFRVGVFVVMSAGLLLLVLERDSAEFVLMATMVVCGLLFLAGIAGFTWMMRRE